MPEPPPAPPLDYTEKARLRTAATLATRIYPGPVGELIYQELVAWETFGYRFDQHGQIARLVAHLYAKQ